MYNSPFKPTRIHDQLNKNVNLKTHIGHLNLIVSLIGLIIIIITVLLMFFLYYYSPTSIYNRRVAPCLCFRLWAFKMKDNNLDFHSCFKGDDVTSKDTRACV